MDDTRRKQIQVAAAAPGKSVPLPLLRRSTSAEPKMRNPESADIDQPLNVPLQLEFPGNNIM